jgi:amidase
MPQSDICFQTATELTRLMRGGQVSAVEVMEAHLQQIERINPSVNAIVTLVADRALDGARSADEALARGQATGPLHGLPLAHKDLLATKGIRTTFGSPIFADFVPDYDALTVERALGAGAISIGKTNTPEFGAGSQTFNQVFGTTLNPYDLSKTCGGSTGGGAVALACGMAPLVDGSDYGGSLRNPASFCNVVGIRSAPGRVPGYPTSSAWSPWGVEGPMARTVEDLALFLSVLAGPDPRVPISIAQPGTIFGGSLERDFHGVRVAWSPDLGGLPVEPSVLAVMNQQRATFEALGCVVEEATPDLTDADEIFEAWRAWSFEQRFGELLNQHRDLMKATVIGEIERGRVLTGPYLARMDARRSLLYQRVREFMDTYEFLVCPVSQVPPFDCRQEYVTEIAGQPMHSYTEWMRSCSRITVTGLPALSVPAGFTAGGLPVGLQIVGRHQAEVSMLQLAYAFQQVTHFWRQRPALVEA